jgi:hypothetical protein
MEVCDGRLECGKEGAKEEVDGLFRAPLPFEAIVSAVSNQAPTLL